MTISTAFTRIKWLWVKPSFFKLCSTNTIWYSVHETQANKWIRDETKMSSTIIKKQWKQTVGTKKYFAVDMPSFSPLLFFFAFGRHRLQSGLLRVMLMRCAGGLYGYRRGLTRLCREIPLIRPHRCQTAWLTSRNSRAPVVRSLKVRCRLISAERLGNMSVTSDPCWLRCVCVWECDGHVCVATAQLRSSELTSLILRGQRIMRGWATKAKDGQWMITYLATMWENESI